ncbi:Ribonuclease D (Rnd) (PDB:5C0Y) (PUBMED:18821773) [Commensalibacter communis]|uniref:Ribonuclease D n=1 Tax=Commensalibacter communis TaxID=2972786 RepID=A0A9W4TJK3_9PROT|nr:ribonuclease D [Commensalibacter communis]CAI3922116.1 Ribonuclease D (Rnd) (PDB:5C0Y) (PUBMED:18821773) [Commensalibacter communis]CAI3922410.1 Ribonuclease D (Rnd) (PDB:5C0Y) (PUBMED:18821773) [Commensalibacter communis]CAI3932639.1 Ribonuclease D (Rnd) (PDB:5C0Y) (PUBMED:18821773) [Commensalibacter communis]CAI3940392.1 Ribonuclease D (Rnd) (PDB:5C0Y) (PUBMED:18821773) [Commensalibacter communis]CAI3940955.1 Ribonuclease D (Rnd) (PDB:5C0Y) (PUBMED:18821773) [Commensalibacter communis]
MINLQKFSKPVMIIDNESLQKMVASLLQEKFVTVDTEFVRERTYWPELCLVQIAGTGTVYLLDALSSDIDLSLLLPLLTAPSVVKVFHAAQQDLEIFLHLLGVLPAPVFDTQVAAMVAGFGNQIGYDSLVESLLKVTIDKSHRFSDWAMRPLTAAQQNYAAADVTYLWDVYLVLLQKLQDTNRLSWVAAEIDVLSDPNFFLPPLAKIWKRLRPKTNNRRVLGCLYAIIQWREEEAQKLNIPRQHLVKDESLLAIAAALPDSVKALSRIRGISHGFAEGKEGGTLLAVIKTVKNTDVESLPLPIPVESNKRKPSEAMIALLKVLLQAKCERYQVAPKLVIDSKDIEKLALGKRDLPVLSGWRRDVFGQDAIDLCNGQLILGVQDQKIELIKR